MFFSFSSLAYTIVFLIGSYLLYKSVMYVFGQPSIKLKVGDRAPDFTLTTDENNQLSLHDLKGHRILVYFFPRSDTPGCIKEACGLRDSYALFDQAHIRVLGISYDTPATLKAFKDKYTLPFYLLSDRTKQVAKLYGAYQTGLGEPFPARISFLIDREGKIIDIIEDVKVETHGQDVLKKFGISIP